MDNLHNKKMKFELLRIALLISAVFTANPCYASSVYSNYQSYLNWDSLSITSDTGVSISWIDKGSYSYGQLEWDRHDDSSANWGNTYGEYILNGDTGAWGETTDNKLSSYAETEFFRTQGYANRYGYFLVSGDGDITFEIDYGQNYNLSRYIDDGVFYQSGSSAVAIGLYNENEGNFAFQSSVLSEPFTTIGDFSGSNTGTLKLTHVFTDGEITRFGAYAASTSTGVSEPATIMLIGTGLVGLVGFRKKFKKRA